MDASALRRIRAAAVLLQRDISASGMPWRVSVDIVQAGGNYLVLVDGQFWGGVGVVLEGADERCAAWEIADATQSTIMETRHVVWPDCPTHARGLHLWPENRGADWEGNPFGTHAWPVWRCREESGHVFGRVGALRYPPD